MNGIVLANTSFLAFLWVCMSSTEFCDNKGVHVWERENNSRKKTTCKRDEQKGQFDFAKEAYNFSSMFESPYPFTIANQIVL